MEKFSLLTTTCRRCGKKIVTTNKSLYGCDNIKDKWDRICSDCMTEEEKFKMLEEQGKAICSAISSKL